MSTQQTENDWHIVSVQDISNAKWDKRKEMFFRMFRYIRKSHAFYKSVSNLILLISRMVWIHCTLNPYLSLKLVVPIHAVLLYIFVVANMHILHT